jgi:hypothetical protein
MAPEENKAVVRGFVEEVFNPGNLAAVDPFLAVEYCDANASLPQLSKVPAVHRPFLHAHRSDGTLTRAGSRDLRG